MPKIKGFVSDRDSFEKKLGSLTVQVDLLKAFKGNNF